MSIEKAIKKAYDKMFERDWDKIYWCIDIHDTLLNSNYDGLATEFAPGSIECLKKIQEYDETVLILWSACHDFDKEKYMNMFAEQGVNFKYFNENPDEANTKVGNFREKFYFSILIDDKAGFDSETDWKEISRIVDWART